MLDLTIAVAEPQLLFSPRVGDAVVVGRDALAEIARPHPGAPQSWWFLAAGTRGRLLDWRERSGAETRAVIELLGASRRTLAFVGASKIARAPRFSVRRA